MKKELNKIVKGFGGKAQVSKSIEELAELIVALSKQDEDNIIEEIADVEIMIAQLKIIFDINVKKLQEIKEYKIIRTMEVLENR